jgi:hypothetical protein
MVLPALIATVRASAQGFLSLLIAAVIAALTAVRAAFRAEEANVIAGSTLLDVDAQLRAALVAGGLGVVDAFTG